MACWWVAQGKSFFMESAGGYLWAPAPGHGDRHFWKSLDDVRLGDVIFSYHGAAISAISVVTRTCRVENRPDGLTLDRGDSIGRCLRAEYIVVEPMTRSSLSVRSSQRLSLQEYKAIQAEFGRELTSAEVVKRAPGLYRRIHLCWGPFSAFQRDAGLRPVAQPLSSGPVLRERCIAGYTALALQLGRSPNSADLVRFDHYLYRMIRVQWGGFPESATRSMPRQPGGTASSRETTLRSASGTAPNTSP